MIPFRESHVFLSDPQYFGPLGKCQHNIEISIKAARKVVVHLFNGYEMPV